MRALPPLLAMALLALPGAWAGHLADGSTRAIALQEPPTALLGLVAGAGAGLVLVVLLRWRRR